MNDSEGNEEFRYTPSGQTPTSSAPAVAKPASVHEEFQWQASEFIDHQKDTNWFTALIGGTVVLCGLIFLLTRSILSTLVVAVAMATFGIYAKQKPRTLIYSLLTDGLKIGEKKYSYDDFRSFSLTTEGGLKIILLEPVGRFIPPLTLYFSPEDTDKVFNILSIHVPYLDKAPDMIDRFMQRIRF